MFGEGGLNRLTDMALFVLMRVYNKTREQSFSRNLIVRRLCTDPGGRALTTITNCSSPSVRLINDHTHARTHLSHSVTEHRVVSIGPMSPSGTIQFISCRDQTKKYRAEKCIKNDRCKRTTLNYHPIKMIHTLTCSLVACEHVHLSSAEPKHY